MIGMTGSSTSQIWQVEEAPRPSGPSKVVLSASRALARRVEDSQPFTRENVELHWKDREATRFDFYFNLQTLKVEDAADRRPESQLTYPARLARLTSKPATPATPFTRATASPSSRLTTPQTPRKTPTSPDSRCFRLSQGHFEHLRAFNFVTSFQLISCLHSLACYGIPGHARLWHAVWMCSDTSRFC